VDKYNVMLLSFKGKHDLSGYMTSCGNGVG